MSILIFVLLSHNQRYVWNVDVRIGLYVSLQSSLLLVPCLSQNYPKHYLLIHLLIIPMGIYSDILSFNYSY